jgi:hypothetical protein
LYKTGAFVNMFRGLLLQTMHPHTAADPNGVVLAAVAHALDSAFAVPVAIAACKPVRLIIAKTSQAARRLQSTDPVIVNIQSILDVKTPNPVQNGRTFAPIFA